MKSALQIPTNVLVRAPQKLASKIKMLRDRVEVVVILIISAALMAIIFFLAALAGIDYWPTLP